LPAGAPRGTNTHELPMTLDEIGRAALATHAAANDRDRIRWAAELAAEIGIRREYAERLLEDYIGYTSDTPEGKGTSLSEYVWLVGVHCVKGD
jgi:hypothetical protein